MDTRTLVRRHGILHNHSDYPFKIRREVPYRTLKRHIPSQMVLSVLNGARNACSEWARNPRPLQFEGEGLAKKEDKLRQLTRQGKLIYAAFPLSDNMVRMCGTKVCASKQPKQRARFIAFMYERSVGGIPLVHAQWFECEHCEGVKRKALG